MHKKTLTKDVEKKVFSGVYFTKTIVAVLNIKKVGAFHVILPIIVHFYQVFSNPSFVLNFLTSSL